MRRQTLMTATTMGPASKKVLSVECISSHLFPGHHGKFTVLHEIRRGSNGLDKMATSDAHGFVTVPVSGSTTASSSSPLCLLESKRNGSQQCGQLSTPVGVEGSEDGKGEAAEYTRDDEDCEYHDARQHCEGDEHGNPAVTHHPGDGGDNAPESNENETKDNDDGSEEDWEKLTASCGTVLSLCTWDGRDEEAEADGERREKKNDGEKQTETEPATSPDSWEWFPDCPTTSNSPDMASMAEDNGLWREDRLQARDQRLLALWEAYFGQGTLSDWQRLMADLGFQREFASKTQCRKVLRSVWVNIPQFLEAGSKPSDVLVFASQRRLAHYTKLTGRIFPNLNIPPGSPLRKLLGHVGRYCPRLPDQENHRSGEPLGISKVSDREGEGAGGMLD
ncbi:hypothetical protein ACRALDRAFT_210464 [Sodiomyces alcalophilus JCM 7366]|uniref:uncharacterized protein n=1 Tax=Sodiomyces alcalophilus JCM 7366 TaxID=591952 RepID=UPI0039B4EE4B